MKKAAVLLSGAGLQAGTEVTELTSILICLSKH